MNMKTIDINDPKILRAHYDVLRALNLQNWGSWDESLYLQGGTYSQYDCDGETATAFKFDKPLRDQFGELVKGFAVNAPRGHLAGYVRLAPGRQFEETDEEKAAATAAMEEYHKNEAVRVASAREKFAALTDEQRAKIRAADKQSHRAFRRALYTLHIPAHTLLELE